MYKLERITGTQLAQLAFDDFCPRCFWLKARSGFKLPYQVFPSIFRDIDGVSKVVTELSLLHREALPPWLPYRLKEARPLDVPQYGKFCFTHASGVVISGQPDHLFRLADERLLILDYKTSRLLGSSVNVYKSQVNIYRVIAKAFGLGETGAMGIVYYEPSTGDLCLNDLLIESDVGQLVHGFQIFFKPVLMRVDEIDVDALILRAKALAEGSIPDSFVNRSGGRCKDCEAVRNLLGVVANETAWAVV